LMVPLCNHAFHNNTMPHVHDALQTVIKLSTINNCLQHKRLLVTQLNHKGFKHVQTSTDSAGVERLCDGVSLQGEF